MTENEIAIDKLDGVLADIKFCKMAFSDLESEIKSLKNTLMDSEASKIKIEPWVEYLSTVAGMCAREIFDALYMPQGG